MDSSRIAIIGAGGGGSACAVGFSLRGFKVNLYSRSLVSARGGTSNKREIEFTGELGEGTASLQTVTSNVQEAIHEAEVVLVVVPAYAQAAVSEQLSLFSRRDQVIVFAPGACATLESRYLLNRVDVIGELLTIPYGGRIEHGGIVNISAPMRAKGTEMRAAAFPASNNEAIIKALGGAIKLKLAQNVLETGMLNPSSVVHPSIMLFNLGPFDENRAEFSELYDGFSASAERLVQQLDSEKLRVCRALEVAPLSISEVYHEFAAADLISRRGGVKGGRKTYSVQERFIDEDVPYGLVLLSSMAKLCRVETPLIDSVIRIMSAARGVNYSETGRNLSRMQIDGFSRTELLRLLSDGSSTGKNSLP